MAVLVAEILISLFAVFGLYAAVRFFCLYLFAPHQLGVSIEIGEEITAEQAAYLVCRARERTLYMRYGHVVACIDRRLKNAEEIAVYFLDLGITCYFIE